MSYGDASQVVSELHGKLQREILTDEADRWSYSFDASFGTFLPDAVIQPVSRDEVVKIVQTAVKYRVPIYPRGTGSSLSGGPLPVYGGIVVDTSWMRDKLEVYPDDLVAVVSPGIHTAEIHRAAEAYGLFYPPDPSSSEVSTIGGNVAENSGGPRGLKYGVTRDYVLGLEIVTPEGGVLRTGGRTVKNVTGYDLTRLIVGSEGTLGIVTEVILRLVPRPQDRRTALIVFDDLVSSGRAISKVLTSGILPCAIELMDQACLIAVESYRPSNLPTDAQAALLIEVDGHPEAVRDEIKKVEAICLELGAKEVRVARNETERQQLWFARKQISPAIARIKPTKISEDATVPRSQIPEMFRRLNQIREKYDLQLVVFGHAGDGNLHPNIMCDIRDDEEMERVEEAVSEIFRAAIELGGTLSGEHGIGTMKAPFLPMEIGEIGLDMTRRIKAAFDPLNIMNPGKIIPNNERNRVVLR
ncbi:FAD-binding oxidoreductase [Alicyclobacillus shizuokensis]|uniref:FAD-binding oxidoreductase n=1 Tax=Alicyclobacillus shizuokensis TaxID=392014 RepID=UPI00082ABC9B|nr:FAD-linked oxidase C-terminal domain-containing protein [Alicyclobacillus shizuokensis]